MKLKQYLDAEINEIKMIKNGIYSAKFKGQYAEVELLNAENHAFSGTVTLRVLKSPDDSVYPIGKVIEIDRGKFGRSFKYIKTPKVF
jgi:hypothetical protein